jgi:hypothetical protein
MTTNPKLDDSTDLSNSHSFVVNIKAFKKDSCISYDTALIIQFIRPTVKTDKATSVKTVNRTLQNARWTRRSVKENPKELLELKGTQIRIWATGNELL